jgi:signal peptidase I
MGILRSLGAFFLDILQVVVFATALFLFMYLLVMQPHKIKGNSMHPNFPDGEYLLTDKVSYRFGEPQRGDVIVFKAPYEDGDEFIKRIIGLPGDTVSVQSGNIYINGTQLEENYLENSIYTVGGTFLGEGETETVPPHQYFVLGDNRDYSSDSRSWGFVPVNKITGRAWVIYWPLQNSGTIDRPTYAY